MLQRSDDDGNDAMIEVVLAREKLFGNCLIIPSASQSLSATTTTTDAAHIPTERIHSNN
jgi:hypothetical protein